MPEVHKFSKNLGANSKFQDSRMTWNMFHTSITSTCTKFGCYNDLASRIYAPFPCTKFCMLHSKERHHSLQQKTLSYCICLLPFHHIIWNILAKFKTKKVFYKAIIRLASSENLLDGVISEVEHASAFQGILTPTVIIYVEHERTTNKFGHTWHNYKAQMTYTWSC
jgi:hypothetical protein